MTDLKVAIILPFFDYSQQQFFDIYVQNFILHKCLDCKGSNSTFDEMWYRLAANP